jgi:hydrogenase maturation protease
MTPTILIAGIGNIFLGDDAFGVEVARSLLARALPPQVHIKDFGIRGFDLAYSMLDPWHTLIMVDAIQRDEAPGTLFLIEPDLSGLGNLAAEGLDLNPHGMDPMHVLNLAASLGSIQPRVLVLGCEANDFGGELEGRMGLSPAVEAAVEEASNMIEELIGRILADQEIPAQSQMEEVTT